MNQRSDQLPNALKPPGPPPELRKRVLAAACEAVNRAEEPDVWMRIWSSRPARLVWAVSVAVLVFGHIAVGSSSPLGSALRALPLTATAEANDELAEVVGLGRLTAQIPAFEVSPNSIATPSARPVESEDVS